MESLLQTAAKRKIEQERIEERKVQKEREKEGDLYGDKEMFVTEAYLKKQEELKKLEEEERRREGTRYLVFYIGTKSSSEILRV